jgi:hypothetical protein
MILIHVEGGDPIPHQLVQLPDYEEFRNHILSNYELLTVFDRTGQQIEVYRRENQSIENDRPSVDNGISY